MAVRTHFRSPGERSMPSSRKPPWKRPNPKAASKATPLSPRQQDAARKRAEEAGRRYPNLVDNMWAARQPR
jgi:hypothetical protein